MDRLTRGSEFDMAVYLDTSMAVDHFNDTMIEESKDPFSVGYETINRKTNRKASIISDQLSQTLQEYNPVRMIEDGLSEEMEFDRESNSLLLRNFETPPPKKF